MGAGVETRTDLEELASRSAEFETAPAGKVMGWAVERFDGALTLACSFQDCVIIDLAVEVDPGIEVLFLDTGFHFPETLAYVEEVRARYDLNLRVVTPARRPTPGRVEPSGAASSARSSPWTAPCRAAPPG